MLFPERFVLAEPPARFGERLSRQSAIRDAADPRARDQPRLLEDAQVLGNGRSRNVERLAELADGTRSASQLLEDRSARGIGQRPEHRIESVDRSHGVGGDASERATISAFRPAAALRNSAVSRAATA